MGEWQPARLIPTSGISGADEAERRATSALLAVLAAVKEFGVAITRPVGAPAGNLATYIEVPFLLGEGKVIPDGLLRVTRGKTSWTALVEVKTGAGVLNREQVESYLDVARIEGFDAVLTISNELAPAPGVHPVTVDGRKTRKVALHHLSWAEVLTHAVRTRVHRGVADPDQAWILGELIRYLEHPKSGALDFADMGGSWVAVREAMAAGTLRRRDPGVAEVASRWDQLLRFAALRLGRELGADVHVVVPRKEMAEPPLRISNIVAELCDQGSLSGLVRVAGAVADIEIKADLRTSMVTTSVDVAAPGAGRALTRVRWLLRQLADAPPGLRVEASFQGTRLTTSELLGTVRERPELLLDPGQRDFRSFRISAMSPAGTKRGVGRGAFIDSVLTATDGFYQGVVQVVRPWTPQAPRLADDARSAAERAGINIDPPETEVRAGEVEPGPQDGLVMATPVPVDESAAEVVEWPTAVHRLDNERRHSD